VAAPAYAGGNAANGKKLYETLCVTCHGPTGLGDGPVAASLPPEMKPRNLQEGQWKYATDDNKMKELLHKGGAAVGLSPLMSGAPSASDADLNDLVAFLHSIRKK
jgi:mono/diheme cytochrome c family protein